MHELSVCRALLIQVSDIVRTRGAQAVERITIEVGPLSGTEPDLLLGAFLAMRCGSAAAALLVILRGVVKIRCRQCGSEGETRPNRLICMNCGAWRTQVIAGDELRLLRVEMRMPEAAERRDIPWNAEQISHV